LNAGSPGNSPPEALDDTASTNEDTSVTVDVLANDADPDGDQLSVDAVTQGQNGAVVNNGTYVTYTPNANFNGFDSFDYTVMDPSGGAAMAIVTVSVTAVNDAPIADPGPDQTVFVTREVTLDGSGSMDVEGDLLSYEWQLIEKPAGSAAVLFDPMAVNPTFIVDLPGTYVAELVVNDGVAASAPGRVTISTANSAPLADAGPDQTAFVGDTVTLDGGGSSDVDGDPLSFAWSLSRVPGGSGATLSDPTSPNPWFIVDCERRLRSGSPGRLRRAADRQ
jgi:hypothetical protein